MLKQLAIKAFPQLPALRAAIESGKWREIQPIASIIGWKSALRLWQALRIERGSQSRKLAKIVMRGYRYPLYFRPGGSDPQVIDQVFHRRDYQAVADLPEVAFILDCGANIGCTTFYLLHHYPEAKAIVIEPDAGNMAMCKKNLRPFQKRVTFLETGVWSKTCSLVVERGKFRDGAEWSFQVRETCPGEPGDVQAVTIQDAITKAGFPRIDLLKVDIEGSEIEVFSNSADWLQKTRNIAIETHGPECERVVNASLLPFNYDLGSSGELMIYRNMKHKSMQTS